MEVKILEACMVTPPPDSPTYDVSLPLTFFDLFALPFQPVQHLFFYETPSNHRHHILLSKLKHSLSLTLRYFLPVAGNLVWPQTSPKPIIYYKKGDGVTLTVAQSDSDFYNLSSKTIRSSKDFHPLVACLVRSGDQIPVISFKITLFQGKGICIGVTTHHSLFDGTSAMLFMKSWASIVKFGVNRELTPSFERKTIVELYPDLESVYLEILKQNLVTSGTWFIPGPERPVDRSVRGTFLLSSLDVSKLKGLVRALLEKDNHASHVSTFTVAYAYVIIHLVNVKPPKNNKVNVAFGFDCRGRLEPPLPKTYFGNCVGECNKFFTSEELLGLNGMALIASFISKSTKNVNDGRPLEGAEEWLRDTYIAINDSETLSVSVVGSSRFEYQNVDFGWGRPRKVDLASINGTGGVSFTLGGQENKGGVEIELSLNECEMKTFSHLFDQGLSNMEGPYKCKL